MLSSLIKISANRKQALEKIEEFEQLLVSVLNRCDISASLPFNTDDIDEICSTSYNYGISLMELEMSDLAEKFICKALTLLNYVSSTMSKWKSNMQDAYSSILRAKSEARKLTSKRECVVFGIESTIEPTLETPRAGPLVDEREVPLSLSMFL